MSVCDKKGFALSFGVQQPAVILVDDVGSKPSFIIDFKKVPAVNFKEMPVVVSDDVWLSFVRQADEGGRAVVFVYFACGEGEGDLCSVADLNNVHLEQVAGVDVWKKPVVGVSDKGTPYFCFMPPADFDFGRLDYGVSFRVFGFTPPVGKAGTVTFSSVPVNFTDVDPTSYVAKLAKRFKVRVKSFRLGKQEWVPGQELLPVDFGVTEELSWDVLNADECFLDGASVALKGTKRVVIDSPKAFVLSAKSIGSSAIAPMQVRLNKPIIVDFSASEECVESGEEVTLSWSVKSCSGVNIVPAPETLDEAKCIAVVRPTVSTDYTLFAYGFDGTTPCKPVTKLCPIGVEPLPQLWTREGKADFPTEKLVPNDDRRIWQFLGPSELVLPIDNTFYSSTNMLNWKEKEGVKKFTNVKKILATMLEFSSYPHRIRVVGYNDDPRSCTYWPNLMLHPDEFTELASGYQIISIPYQQEKLHPGVVGDPTLFFYPSKNKTFIAVCVTCGKSFSYVDLWDDLEGSTSDKIDCVDFDNGLLFAVRDADNHLITFYFTNLCGDRILKKIGTYNKKVNSWFKLIGTKRKEVYLLYDKAVVDVSTLKSISAVPPRMDELPYTCMFNNRLFVITKDKNVWSFNP